MKTSLHQIQPYVTRDGSLIRELMHPQYHGNTNLSFAQAIIAPGQRTIRHVHKSSEEVYHIVQGTGMMTLGKKVFPVGPGDTVCIPQKIPHKIEYTSHEPLIFFCCCAPPYAHGDTEILAEME